jgi:REP element-mobilizing transposase RayT
MVTRRCAHRAFRLKPSPEMNAIWIYCLAMAAERSGVRICAVGVMSSHYHAVVFDPEGNISLFVQVLHRLVAKCVNALQRQRENVWASDRPNLLLLGDEEDVIEKIAYVAANPVEAGLVGRPEEWPGLLLLPTRRRTGFVRRRAARDAKRAAVELRAVRPKAYFGSRSSSPRELVLRLWTPQLDNFAERVDAAIAERVLRAHARAQEEGWSFLGPKGVLATSFEERARSYEETRKLVPVLAARKPELRKALKEARREFLAAYYWALERWREGRRDVEFPLGTWWMRVHHKANIAGAH